METSTQISSSVPSKARLPRRPTCPPSPPETDRESVDSTPEPGDPEAAQSWPSGDGASHPRLRSSYSLPPESRPDNVVLPDDLKTPDSHVKRDPRLIRLTGIHPFNVEAPLTDLFDQGFVTTKDLHFVRNHGAVPRVEDSEVMEWDFTVEGMVENPIRMSLAELIGNYEQATYPVTLVCAGNRRKEQNVVRKTKGFSWGAAGLSTALWTGVPLRDVIGAARPRRGARYVCFEGADKLPNGHYGTSIRLSWAVDPERGVMLAHKMNGETLPPDHGRPLRVVIPGQIGGRSVKWLKRIIVTDRPSDNWYHIYDNRVLPTMIDPEMSANLPGTWRDDRYAIYDLNTNSATCYPAHDEEVELGGAARSYNVRGYAYSGGGKRVTRVEVTLDKGKTWMLANVSYPEDQYRLSADREDETLFGGRIDISWRSTSFCWCFWDLDIPLARLQDADDMMVRAMDESMMVQPRDMYWSVLGMMNNPWFRVVVHKEGHKLRFEHPTQPALQPGGWMERVKKSGGDLTNGHWGEQLTGQAEVVEPVERPAEARMMVNENVDRVISLAELKAHEGEEEPWFVVNGEVYDGTAYLESHPGGATSITGVAGQDASEEFLAIHSENAKSMLVDYHIGTLDEASRALLASSSEEGTASPVEGESALQHGHNKRDVFLQHKSWTKAILSAKKSVSHDSKIFTFDLEHPEQTLGLPVGQHLMMRLHDPVTREAILRAYTPLPTNNDGKLDVLVKVYPATRSHKGGGRMTQALDALPIGHAVDFRGPHGRFEYLGRGLCSFSSSSRERRARRFIMVCGGSGITPVFAVLRAVLSDPEDRTYCVVLDGNRTEQDILCRADLDDLAIRNPDRCRITHALSQPDPSWTGERGRIGKDLIVRQLEHGAGEGVEEGERGGEDIVLVCGPAPLEESILDIFTSIGWNRENMFFF
ncbi:nitrate reductase [Xylariaceae sp. FL0594]|nr:nitrate reductase [Xylariaceae sp. FL0594]